VCKLPIVPWTGWLRMNYKFLTKFNTCFTTSRKQPISDTRHDGPGNSGAVLSISGICTFSSPLSILINPTLLSRHSAGLRAGRSGFWGSIPGGGWKFFSKASRPERLWDPPSLLSNGYQGLFLWG
jgi:hypothetical protein